MKTDVHVRDLSVHERHRLFVTFENHLRFKHVNRWQSAECRSEAPRLWWGDEPHEGARHTTFRFLEWLDSRVIHPWMVISHTTRNALCTLTGSVDPVSAALHDITPVLDDYERLAYFYGAGTQSGA